MWDSSRSAFPSRLPALLSAPQSISKREHFHRSPAREIFRQHPCGTSSRGKFLAGGECAFPSPASDRSNRPCCNRKKAASPLGRGGGLRPLPALPPAVPIPWARPRKQRAANFLPWRQTEREL